MSGGGALVIGLAGNTPAATLERLATLLVLHPGPDPVQLEIRTRSDVRRLRAAQTADAFSAELWAELTALLGPQAVRWELAA